MVARTKARKVVKKKKNQLVLKLSAKDRIAARRAIARDVLRLEKANVLVMDHKYLGLNTEMPEGEGSMKPHIKNMQCEVCALGALFVGMVDQYNRCTIQDFSALETLFDTRRIMQKKLSPYFTKKELDLIEDVYEGTCIHSSHPYYFQVLATSFFRANGCPHERIIKICKVIARTGEFDLVKLIELDRDWNSDG